MLDTAERLFREQGYAATTVREIAEAASVSVGTVMSVADKRGLLVATMDRGLASTDESDDAGRDDPDGDPVARVLAVLRPFVDLFADNPDVAREYGAVLFSGVHDSRVFEQLAVRLIERMAARLERQGYSPERARSVSRVIHRAYLGELFVWAGSGALDPGDPLRELEQTVRVILAQPER
ncbi:TetR/AcrR family transcriptional regulator [Microbacterium sp. 18062]|uniref:TetR/AcrR family transcriptional regulator n=1 Tax=Microbacterium sp. 18062 TaxID=2681410 RepID=UPI00135C1517|nr:TetR/AcrR family transcriptional regulator [Microbacterium sp. 18062]